jgi:hypothetical protein
MAEYVSVEDFDFNEGIGVMVSSDIAPEYNGLIGRTTGKVNEAADDQMNDQIEINIHPDQGRNRTILNNTYRRLFGKTWAHDNDHDSQSFWFTRRELVAVGMRADVEVEGIEATGTVIHVVPSNTTTYVQRGVIVVRYDTPVTIVTRDDNRFDVIQGTHSEWELI